jgi:Rieske 2Fe-2S family protein
VTSISLRQAFAQVVRPFPEATSLPGQVYCDSDIFNREAERIFSNMWLCVGHRTCLTTPGEVRTIAIGTESVLLTMDQQEQRHAFYNVCRHRGARLIPAGENKKCQSIVCPYHSWAYRLDGKLQAAPMMNGKQDFAKADFPLVPVRLEEYQGFLFINLDDQAESVAVQFSDFPDLSAYQLPGLVCVARHEYDVAANWKLICENYSECYHCQGMHPQLHRVSSVKPGEDLGMYVGANYNGGPMSLNEGCNVTSESGKTNRPPFPNLAQEQRRLIHYFNLHPNLLLSLSADNVMTHYIWPVDADNVHIQTEWFFLPEVAAMPGFDPSDVVDFWDLTNRQDWALSENVQRGIHSRGQRPGPYQSGEGCVHAFDRWYVERLGLA